MPKTPTLGQQNDSMVRQRILWEHRTEEQGIGQHPIRSNQAPLRHAHSQPPSSPVSGIRPHTVVDPAQIRHEPNSRLDHQTPQHRRQSERTRESPTHHPPAIANPDAEPPQPFRTEIPTPGGPAIRMLPPNHPTKLTEHTR